MGDEPTKDTNKKMAEDGSRHSLTIRLYANMFAGEQVTMVFLGMTYLAVPAIFMGLHVFVGVLQAYIFMLLTMFYVGSAVSHGH